MSQDEILFLGAFGVAAAWLWLSWLRELVSVHRVYRPSRLLVWPVGAACAGGLVLVFVLKFLAADDVRGDLRYIAFYMVMGAAWVGAVLVLFPWFGLSPRDDVAERGNAAAAIASSGAILGATVCFAGPNIGDGPGFWCVAFAALLSTGAWLAAWVLFEAVAGASESITVDRDVAAGVRFAALFVTLGLLFGRGAAGVWTSARDTVSEFAAAWPAVPLLALGIVLERVLRPTTRKRFGSVLVHGLVPALVYVSVAVAGLLFVGAPP